DVAQIDPDAKPDVPVLGNPGIALLHAALYLDGAARRIEDAAELDQEAVAHHLEDAAVMLGDRWIEELAAVLLQGTHRPLLIGLHQPAVAHHIGCQYGGKPTLNALFAHARPRTTERMTLYDTITIGQHYRPPGRKSGLGQQRGSGDIRAASAYHLRAATTGMA